MCQSVDVPCPLRKRSRPDFSMIQAAQHNINPNSPLTKRVLVLNRLYMAVRIVPARRAFQLLCKNLAEVIAVEDGRYYNYDFSTWMELGILQASEEQDDNDDWVQTVRFAIPVPRVVRLLTYDRLPQRQIKLNRRNIMARDHHTCQYCEYQGSSSHLTIDHIVPRSKGGKDTWTNLATACKKCNSRKGGRTPEQANMPLLHPPKKPRINPMVTARLRVERYECWNVFLKNANWAVDVR